MRVGERSRAQAPTVAVEPKSVDDPEPTNDAQQIAAKNIDYDMVPPALLEIVEHVAQTVLDEFE